MTDGTMACDRIDYDLDVASNTNREYVTGTPENNVRLDARRPVYLDDDTYSQALSAFVVACIDLLVIHPDGRVLLGKRQQEPQPDWWVIGGRMRTRETYAQAAARNIRRELGIVIDADRLDQAPIGVYSLVWDTRQQEPQSDGCHMLSILLVYRTTEAEVESIRPNVEYAQVAWVELGDVGEEIGYHPALRQMAYDAISRRG